MRTIVAVTLGTLAAGALVAGAACSSKSPAAAPGHDASAGSDSSSSGSGSLAGSVSDLTGKPVAGVEVAVGSHSAITAADGTYTLPGVPAGTPVVATYTAAGYSDTSERTGVLAGKTTTQNVVLVALGTAHPLDATAGGTVTGARGASLTAGAGVFVDGSGKPVTGSVDVYLTPLDPAVTSELAAYPGSLVGVGTGGTSTMLETYGVLDVTVMQGSQKLQIASGKTVTVQIPTTVAGGAPTQTNLWSFESTTGLWKLEGMTSMNGATFTAALPHLSFWNIDAAVTGGGCMTGRVVDSMGSVVNGAIVTPTGVGYTLLDEVPGGDYVSPTSPQYCVWAKPNAKVKLTALAPGGIMGMTSLAAGSITTTTGPGITYRGGPGCPAGCTQVPDIVLGKDQMLSDGGSSACLGGGAASDAGAPDGGSGDAAANNPFAGTCASSLVTFSQCFSAGATGSCATTVQLASDAGLSQVLTTYMGGSSIQTSGNPSGATSVYRGANQMLCGSGTFNLSTSTMVLTLPPDQAFQFNQGGTLVCPDGTVISLSGSQSDAVSGCTSLAPPCSGSDAGVGQGSVACAISQSGATVTCMVYENLSPPQVTQQQSNCALETGQVVSSCPVGGLQGCCTTTSAAGTVKTCYYQGTASQLMTACTAQQGTWSSN